MLAIKIDNPEIKEYIQDNTTIIFGYLFGSYANGTYTSSSDVDVALYLSDLSLDNRLQINYELSKLLKKDVDLVVLNEVKNIYLLENILSESLVIKESEQRFDFELVKQHDILDYKEFKRMIDAA
jgi:predicted nucleotidyltransferase